MLRGKRVLVAITGGIAAYKSCEIIRLLQKQGADVRAVMTQNAQAFITPMTLQALTGHSVGVELMDLEAEAAMGHIELAKWAEIIVVAPASANTIAKLAHGHADNLLSTICLATTADIYICPAMNQQMWQHVLVQKNIELLQSINVTVFGPAHGEQACGDVGVGNLLAPAAIVDALCNSTESKNASLKPVTRRCRVLITLGPTREYLDPVRYLTNESSGLMGLCLANAFMKMNAEVTVVAGPTRYDLSHIPVVTKVTTAEELYQAVKEQAPEQDIFVSTAAVSDYTFPNQATHKLKKEQGSLVLDLVPTVDVLSTVVKQQWVPFVVGFAAETDHLIQYAQQKLENKCLDMMVANQVGVPTSGFNSDYNSVTVLSRDGVIGELPSQPKQQIANDLVRLIYQHWRDKIEKDSVENIG